MAGRINKSGMTFTEVIIAMLILSLVVAGSFAAFAAGTKFTMRAQRRAIAMNFGRQTIERLRNDVRASTWPDDPGGPLEQDVVHSVPITAGRLPAGATRKYVVKDIDVSSPLDGIIDYKKVTVTVEWTEP